MQDIITTGLFVFFLAAILFAHHAEAITDLTITINDLSSIENELFSIDDIELSLTVKKTDEFELKLSTSNIKSKLLDNIKSLKIKCDLIYIKNNFLCENGELSIDHPLFQKKANLSFIYSQFNGLTEFKLIKLHFIDGIHSIKAKKKSNEWNISFNLTDVNLNLLHTILISRLQLLNNFPIDSGIIDLNGEVKLNKNSLTTANLTAKINQLNLDSEQVLEEVSLISEFFLQRTGTHWEFNTKTYFNSGALYIVPGFEVFNEKPGFYFNLDQENIFYSLSGKADLSLTLFAINDFNYNHGDYVQATGKGKLNLNSESIVEFMNINLTAPDLTSVFPVYIQPILLATNYGDLATSGSMNIDITHDNNQLKFLNLTLDNLYIDDQLNRFNISNLNSQIKMQDSKEKQFSTITWDSLGIYKFLFGPSDMEFTSINNNYSLSEWKNISLFDGGLAIETLVLDQVGEPDFTLKLGGKLQPISLDLFTQVMQWPLMSGTLEGEISGFEYTNNNLIINGDINFKVFDGNILLSDLKIDNLFSTNSRLTTNMDLYGLDLEQLTNTFTFGKIQGTLNGKMHDFTLESWQPVSFDAEFATPEDDDRPHRISQRALENLSEIGGGLSSALSNTLLKFVPEYSYGQLGLSCKLEKGVCNLGGVKQTEQGFYILTRGGLLPPWVDVMGTGRSILWDNLIDGLKQISEGEVRFE